MNSNKNILIALASVSFLLSLPKIKKHSGVLILITMITGYCVTKDITTSVAVALISGAIFVSLNNISPTVITKEHFKSAKEGLDGEEAGEEEELDATTNDDGEEGYDEEEEDATEEEDEEAEEEADEEEEEDFQLDTKGSFYENYQSLSKTQVRGLNKDTQNLIKTQRNLIETLNNMGPALKDGRQILDTFKNYFGNEADIGKAMTTFKA
tara:strand:- start:4436 stop:5065 length:630 start_codon:yes stop_codon:yes gene_type:complete